MDLAGAQHLLSSFSSPLFRAKFLKDYGLRSRQKLSVKRVNTTSIAPSQSPVFAYKSFGTTDSVALNSKPIIMTEYYTYTYIPPSLPLPLKQAD